MTLDNLDLVSALRVALALAALLAGTSCRVPTSQHISDLTAARVVYFHQTFGAGPDLTTNSAGQLEEDRRTEPFGVAIDAFRDGAVQPIDYLRDPINALNKFTDPDTQWSYHGARWLAPDTAQWHSPDPPATAPDPKFMAEPWALHPYQYVNQNPVAYWDPDGRDPVPQIPYVRAQVTPHGASVGFGMVNGDITSSVNAQVLRADVSTGIWKDANGTMTEGHSAQADVAKVNIPPTADRPIGTDFGVFNTEAVCTVTDTDVVIGAEANIVDGAITFGTPANHVRVGLAAGLGFEMRYGVTDVDHDGLKEGHFGFDVGIVEGDVQLDQPHAVAAANVDVFVGYGLMKAMLPAVLQDRLPPLEAKDLRLGNLMNPDEH
jgi:RHS repeat-associated protein